MALHTLPKNFSIKGKRILVRVDFNVPLKKAGRRYKVIDDTRLRYVLPTILRLRRAGAKVILMSHLGQPTGKTMAKYKMKPVVEHLARLLPPNLPKPKTANHWDFLKLQRAINKMKNGEILVLENLRFCKGETENNRAFAKNLSSLAQVYINEGFSVSHRAHASVAAICQYLPHYAGWQFAREINALDRAVKHTKKPLVLVIGGAKVHDKIIMMINLSRHIASVLPGGVVANTLLKVAGIPIGASLRDTKAPIKDIKRLLDKNKFLYLPIDVVAARGVNGRMRIVNLSHHETVEKDEMILDIGPETIKMYSKIIVSAKTIIWNGPLGLIEQARFQRGSAAVAREIVKATRLGAFSLAGGGESISILQKTKTIHGVSHISTGGGAMLEYLSGKQLPGVEALKRS